jgi:Relaxase/Mobilisation nuclease domain
MVARISHSSNLAAVLNYNEKKVTQNVAELIHASGFLKDIDRMNFYDKSERFQHLNELNTRTQVNMLHISLNFDPSEHLTKQKLSNISDRYMEGVGLKDQPYLIYLHTDAGHPHVHIVSNIIRSDGTRIATHNMGREKSEVARKAIEKEFNLVRAEDSRSQKQLWELQPLDARKVIYGSATETKRP